MKIRLNNIILLVATLVLQGLMIYSIYQSRLKYARNAPYYVANSLQYIPVFEEKLKDADFLENPEAFSDNDFSTAEVFAIDDGGNLTIDVNNLEAGDYLPYSSLFKSDVGSTYYQGRFIGWAKYKDYVIIYRKYLSEVVYDNLAQTIVLWVLFFIVVYFNNKSSVKDLSQNQFENGIRLRIYEDFFYNYTSPRIVIDENMIIYDVNKLFEKAFKVTSEKIKGIRVDDYFKDFNQTQEIEKFIKSDDIKLDLQFNSGGKKIKLEISKSNYIIGEIYVNATVVSYGV